MGLVGSELHVRLLVYKTPDILTVSFKKFFDCFFGKFLSKNSDYFTKIVIGVGRPEPFIER
jgi:hypothetical protein